MELLEVANRISPGISRLRGVILYELQATLAAYARRKFSAGEISAEHMRNIMKVRKKEVFKINQICATIPPRNTRLVLFKLSICAETLAIVLQIFSYTVYPRFCLLYSTVS
jgi:hypothetical protein